MSKENETSVFSMSGSDPRIPAQDPSLPSALSLVMRLDSTSLGIPKCISHPHVAEDKGPKSGITRRYVLIKASPDGTRFLSIQAQDLITD